jgi:hypothetical protein
MAVSYAVPTMKVTLKGIPEQVIVINESDFDPDLHDPVNSDSAAVPDSSQGSIKRRPVLKDRRGPGVQRAALHDQDSDED